MKTLGSSSAEQKKKHWEHLAPVATKLIVLQKKSATFTVFFFPGHI